MALLNRFSYDLNVDKHSPAASARSTKRRVRGVLMSVGVESCVHEQVAKLGPVSRAAGMDCECPLYWKNTIKNLNTLTLKAFKFLRNRG